MRQPELPDTQPAPETPETPPAPEAQILHGTCPVTLPDLHGLTVAELQALRGYIQSQSRDARKKSVQMLMKAPGVHKLWLETLKPGLDHDAREKATSAFHAELGRHPEAFMKHMYANSLIKLADMIRDNMLERAGETLPSKKGRP